MGLIMRPKMTRLPTAKINLHNILFCVTNLCVHVASSTKPRMQFYDFVTVHMQHICTVYIYGLVLKETCRFE